MLLWMVCVFLWRLLYGTWWVLRITGRVWYTIIENYLALFWRFFDMHHPLQHVQPMLGKKGQLPTLRVGNGCCQLFFWQPNSLLAVGTWELVAFVPRPKTLAAKSNFGRILPKLKVGSQSSAQKVGSLISSYYMFLNM